MHKFDLREKCEYCGGPHNIKICPKTWSGSVKRRVLRCSYCGSEDHDYDSCPKHTKDNMTRRINIERFEQMMRANFPYEAILEKFRKELNSIDVSLPTSIELKYKIDIDTTAVWLLSEEIQEP